MDCEQRAKRRKIQRQWIAATLEHPARTENDPDDPELAHALRPIAERGFRVLRVIYNERCEPVRVVTVFFDDGVTDL
ncbi:DUF4258 domain-containing protein [Sulfuricystis multivorans]|uniref:DUF4258 domain-containing protein n=1 Tax=Sulfuricystis multivorans TaxID=2211108 RepID=UPI000F82DC45|nr:DUF4258 domain-containing protein [Sulfuricystis multivorans]